MFYGLRGLLKNDQLGLANHGPRQTQQLSLTKAEEGRIAINIH
jgi:hypothetical protein